MPLSYGSIVGNQENWANIITNVEMAETPFIDWLPVGSKQTNVELSYQAEKYDDPEENTHVDGKPITGFKSAGDGRARLRALVQYFTKTSAVTTLHQDVADIDGVADELARDILKRTKELGRDMEAAFLEGTDHQEGSEVQGYKTRGVGSWISSSAQALYPVPEDFRPPSASIDTTASASLTEAHIIGVLESMGTVTKSPAPKMAFAGWKAKRAFNNMTLFTPGSTLLAGSPTGATGVVYQKPLEGRAIDRIMERYNSDFGPVDLVISYFNRFFNGTAAEKAHTTYFLHQKNWELRWNKKPEWYRKEYEGGAYEAFCESIAMLVCKNPKGEGKYQPTA